MFCRIEDIIYLFHTLQFRGLPSNDLPFSAWKSYQVEDVQLALMFGGLNVHGVKHSKKPVRIALKNGEYYWENEERRAQLFCSIICKEWESGPLFPPPKSRSITSRSQSNQTIYRALHHLHLSYWPQQVRIWTHLYLTVIKNEMHLV